MRNPWSQEPETVLAFPSLNFRFAGIPVEIQAIALLVAAWAVESRHEPLAECVWIGVAVLSILWHELGHALTMKAFGFRPAIELHAAGGVARWPPRAEPTVRQRLVVTLCGPAAGLALGGLIWLGSSAAGDLPRLARVAVADALWINLGWSLVNLMPVLPFDGGLALDCVAEMATGVWRPRWVGMVSLVAGGGGAFVAATRGLRWAALLGLFGALEGWARWRGQRILPFRIPTP
jgi:hypothetical protein